MKKESLGTRTRKRSPHQWVNSWIPRTKVVLILWQHHIQLLNYLGGLYQGKKTKQANKRTHCGLSMAVATAPLLMFWSWSWVIFSGPSDLSFDEVGYRTGKARFEQVLKGHYKCLQHGTPRGAARQAVGGDCPRCSSNQGSWLLWTARVRAVFSQRHSYFDIFLFLVGLTAFKEVCGDMFFFPERKIYGSLLIKWLNKL